MLVKMVQESWSDILDKNLYQDLFGGKYAFPIANEENRALEKQLKEKQKEVAVYNFKLQESNLRIKTINDHFRDVQQQLQYTQQIYKARQRELDAEVNLQKLLYNEEQWLLQQIQQYKKEIKDLHEKQAARENSITQNQHIIEEIKTAMQWDNSALGAWLEEQVRQEEDILALLKYTEHDESKIKAINLQLQRLNEEEKKKKQELYEANTDVTVVEIQLDHMAEEFRRAHQERQGIIEQWEQTVIQMQHRNVNIRNISKQIETIQEEEAKLQEALSEKQEMLSEENTTNRELERRITLGESELQKLRGESAVIEKEKALAVEIDALKNVASHTARKVHSFRNDTVVLQQEIEDKRKKLQILEQEKKTLDEELHSKKEQTMTTAERMIQMEMLLQKEEAYQLQMEAELAKLQDFHFQRSQELQTVLDFERNLKAEIKGVQASNRNLDSRLRQLDQNGVSQEELVYHLDYEIQQLHQRIAHMAGEKREEEQVQLELEVQELKESLDSQTSTYCMLSQEVKKTEEGIRYWKRKMEKICKEREDLDSKLHELYLHNETAERESRNMTSQKEDILVEESLLKVKLKGLHQVLNDCVNTKFAAQKHQLDIETAVKERKEEIKCCKEMLQTEINLAQQKKHKLSQQLQECNNKINKLQMRYQVLLGTLGVNEEDEKSPAYLLIKAAQEKEELRLRGKELSAVVSQAEEEMVALKNSVELVLAENTQLRQTLKPLGEEGEEQKQLLSFQSQLSNCLEKLHEKEKQCSELQNDCCFLEQALEDVSNQKTHVQSLLQEKDSTSTVFQKELEEQKKKITRAEKQTGRINAELQELLSQECLTNYKKDIRLRLLQEVAKRCRDVLVDLSDFDLNINEELKKQFVKANIPFPTKRNSPHPSRACSHTSLHSLSSASSLKSNRSDNQIPTSKSSRLSLSNRASGSYVSISPAKIQIGTDFPVSGMKSPSSREQ
ncbi:coiled-coil domain-containing protein 39-like [Limulus polyphemus]|uniref:Coiled-coil domain-containing protein 39 n=1 Tax=Limulus polyphemus TaxID=6850 RepID=A0ABM1SUD0_LIMPO|nr:coiled-coil domain-containing protein 39-like [Limulus polyphemus]XP_022247236.1 coiled-coil domain-containing protein 39-like [Limulus polyphemus]XP_022247238.1 coiled-coil domain-containing protein 39-like [Limulus polyphemus]